MAPPSFAARSHDRLSATRDTTPRLTVSRYEYVASGLVATLIFVGLLVACLVVMWFSSRFYIPVKPIPVTRVDAGGSGGQGSVGLGGGLETPSTEQLAAQTDLAAFDLEQTVAAIAADTGTRRAKLDDLTQAGSGSSQGGGAGTGGSGRGTGLGAGDGSGQGLPRAQRWEIRFARGVELNEYARILDHFGIELGVVGAGNELICIAGLSQPTPPSRVVRRGEEQRLYMSWRRGELQEADRTLAQRAGVNLTDKQIVQFYSTEVENVLAELEERHAGRKAASIRKTIFGVRRQGAEYEFYVIDQWALGPVGG